MPQSLSARVRMVAVVRFPDCAVGSQYGNAGAGYFGDATTEHPQVLFVARLADVQNLDVLCSARSRENRVIVQELMQPIHDVQPKFDGFQHDAAFAR